MEYQYPDGNKVVFVMFLFNVTADLSNGLVAGDGTLIYNDKDNESLQLRFMYIEDIEIEKINSVQKPVFIDLKEGSTEILRN